MGRPVVACHSRAVVPAHLVRELTTRVLLSPITTDAALNDLMSDSRSRLWKSGGTTAQLQRKQGPAFKAYLYTMAEMGDIMKGIAENLDIDRALTVSQSSPRRPHLHMLILRALVDPQRTRGTHPCKPSYLSLQPRCLQVRVQKTGEIRDEIAWGGTHAGTIEGGQRSSGWLHRNGRVIGGAT